MGTLYVISTPIGNLEDITLRALKILKEVNLIACEDTRQTQKLLKHYQIEKPLVSYHQHSGLTKIDYLINKLRAGQNLALVSDAGTPGISDPGGILVAKAYEQKIKVVPIPGPAGLTTAASVSGFPTDKFIFLGFLPHKKGRKTLLESLKQESKTLIFYESPHRILKTLEELKNVLGEDRQIVVARELTKMFEEIIRGSIKEVLDKLKTTKVKGEFVVVVKSK